MKSIDSEGEGDEVPCVGLLVDRLVDELVDASAKVAEHGHHVAEEIVADVNLKKLRHNNGQNLKNLRHNNTCKRDVTIMV